jgi:hypothetical protein
VERLYQGVEIQSNKDMSDDIPIGPNPCYLCGGEYGQHANDCKVPKMQPKEVSMIDLILQIEELKGEVFRLKMRVRELESGETPIAANWKEKGMNIPQLEIKIRDMGEIITRCVMLNSEVVKKNVQIAMDQMQQDGTLDKLIQLETRKAIHSAVSESINSSQIREALTERLLKNLNGQWATSHEK